MRWKERSLLWALLLMIIDFLPMLFWWGTNYYAFFAPDRPENGDIVFVFLLLFFVGTAILFPCGLWIRKRFFLKAKPSALLLFVNGLTLIISLYPLVIWWLGIRAYFGGILTLG